MEKILKLTTGKRIMSILLIASMIVMWIPASVLAAGGETENGFAYKIVGDDAQITGYTGDSVNVVVPSEVADQNGTYTVESFGVDVFKGNTVIESIKIPDTMTQLTTSIVNGCTNLKTIELPNTLTTIRGAVFSNSGLEEIYIPASVTKIYFKDLFKGCDKLTKIEVDSENENYSSEDGMLYEKDTLYICPPGLTNAIIPEGTTSIVRYAFQYSNKIKYVQIPSTVTTIDTSTFEGSSIKEITIPSSVTKINGSTFKDCTSLTKVTLDNGITEIVDSAFKGCTSLNEIVLPESVTKIGNYTFVGCTSLKNVVLNDGITNIGGYTFEGCTNLEDIIVPKSVKNIGDSVFYGCTSLRNIVLKDGITSIGQDAFNGCTNLKHIALPESINTVKVAAFRDCAIEEITIPGSVSEIPLVTFENCSSLKKVILKNGIKTIGERAFIGCTNLTDIVIPQSVTNIDVSAFNDIRGFTIYGYVDSYAQTFAEQNQYIFKILADQQAKQAANEELESYKNHEDYRETQKQELQDIIVQARQEIDEALYQEEIDDIVSSAKEALDQVKTNAQLVGEEQAEAQPVVEMINALPEVDNVTLSDEEDIQEVYDTYNELSEGAKEFVTNKGKLDAAQEKINILKDDKEAADEVIGMIEDLPENITLEDKTQVQEARAAYERLTAARKELVNQEKINNEAKIKTAEDTIKKLTEDKEEIEKVINLINEIPETVTVNDAEKITHARNKYNELSEEQKALVTNEDTLKKAEASLEKLQADKAAADSVIAKINALPATIILADKAKITEALQAYEKLTPAQKALVANAKKLMQAKSTIGKLEAEKSAIDKAVEDIKTTEGNKITLKTEDINKLTTEILSAMKETGKQVTFEKQEKGRTIYSWTFEGDKITNMNQNTDLNLNFETPNKAAIDEITGDTNSLYISFIHHGNLPAPATVEIYAGDKYKDVEKVNLYYYNEETGKAEQISTGLEVKDGYVTFTITHCSDYFLTQKDLNEESTGDNRDNEDKENSDSTKSPKTTDTFPLIQMILILFGTMITAIYVHGKKATK